jgi:hypothetical protein
LGVEKKLSTRVATVGKWVKESSSTIAGNRKSQACIAARLW